MKPPHYRILLPALLVAFPWTSAFADMSVDAMKFFGHTPSPALASHVNGRKR